MTHIFHNSMNRRSFIKASVAAMGAVVTIGSDSGPASADSAKTATRWALLSDTHIPADVENNYRGFYPYKNLQAVAADVASASPDAAAITGDLARLEGLTGDYENLKSLLGPVAEKMPVFMALGKHDDRKKFTKVFTGHPGHKQQVRGKHVLVAENGPVRLIFLDSLLYVNKVAGLMGKVQRQWLEKYLKQCDDRPAVLCFHHTIGDGGVKTLTWRT